MNFITTKSSAVGVDIKTGDILNIDFLLISIIISLKLMLILLAPCGNTLNKVKNKIVKEKEKGVYKLKDVQNNFNPFKK